MADALTILAFDTAGAACSAALWRDGEVLARRFETMARGHAERLVPMIEEVMAEAGLDYAALDRIAVTRGPGGFTGVRIGLAAARGLALASGRPLVAVSNLQAVAAGVGGAERGARALAVLLDAKRADLYVQAFAGDLTPLTEPRALRPAALADFLPPGPLLLVGDAVAQGHAALSAAGRDVETSRAPAQADPARVAELAAARSLPPADAPPPAALYLRAPDVTPPRDPNVA